LSRHQVKVGDIVILLGTLSGSSPGVLLEKWCGRTKMVWWRILRNGDIIEWPESQLEVISENR